jgi:hypothetical protein
MAAINDIAFNEKIDRKAILRCNIELKAMIFFISCSLNIVEEANNIDMINAT